MGGDEKVGEFDTVFVNRRSIITGGVVGSEVQSGIEETLALTDGDRFVAVDTKDLRDVVPV